MRRRAESPYQVEVRIYLAEDEAEQSDSDDSEDERVKKMHRLGVLHPTKDHWEVDTNRGKVIRHHVRKRRSAYNPVGAKDLPVSIDNLEDQRMTIVKSHGRSHEDDWRGAGRVFFQESCLWTGRTEFSVKEGTSLENWVAAKKGQDEVDLRKESPESLEKWKVADAAEWEKMASSGAVKVLSVEESRAVRARLKAENQEDRVLPTKIARRYKPGEQPGEKPSRKSRLCIRGDLDPDVLELERFAPTVTTLNFNILLQVAANSGMSATVGDLKNAFCQSRPLSREKGALYFQQPREGIQGLHPEQIVWIINGVYGLVDAPLHWRKSLVQDLEALGYRASRMDPCLFLLFNPKSELEGAIAVEVDDLFTVGHGKHHEQMDKLQKKYTFGKYVQLRGDEKGASFNGRRIKQLADGGFLIDMQKFVEERLNPIVIQKGRASQRKEEVTEEERGQARAVCGALNWLSKEGRPDASGPSSLMSSRLTTLKVEDLIQINDVVKNLKANAEIAVKIQPLRSMQLSVITDASFGNNGHHSQGGQVILSHEPGLRDGHLVKANLLAWRSAKLQRVVNSTLAAETQSMGKGLGDLMWTKVLLKELTDPNFVMKKWKEKFSHEDVLVLSSETSDERLRESLAIVDAKSLYDYLSRDTVGGQDRRTAIEIQIIREDLHNLNGQVRWVDHPAMVADPLTKVKGNVVPMYRLLESGRFSIKAEEAHMKCREEAKTSGQSVSQIRRSGIKENFGSCESSHDIQTEH